MRAFRDPGGALSEVACATPNSIRATFRAMAPWNEGWCRVVWFCAASVSRAVHGFSKKYSPCGGADDQRGRDGQRGRSIPRLICGPELRLARRPARCRGDGRSATVCRPAGRALMRAWQAFQGFGDALHGAGQATALRPSFPCCHHMVNNCESDEEAQKIQCSFDKEDFARAHDAFGARHHQTPSLMPAPMVAKAGAAGNRQDQGQPDQPRPASQRFAVRQNDLAPVARPGAASYAAQSNVLAR